MESLTTQTFFFNDFDLDGAKRLLLKQGKPVSLNSKTFDLLFALVENHGQILSKDELLEKVWVGQFVEENNLTVHISALRKIFGEKKGEHHFIVTVPGKGYKFVANVKTFADEEKEIVIENHSFSRIILEEEVTENGKSPDSSNGHARKAIEGVETSEKKQTRIEWLKLNPVITALFGAFLLFAAIGGGYVWQKQRQSNLPPATPFTQAQVKQLTTNGKVSIAAFSPDGKLFAYVVNDLGQRSLWLGYVEGGNDIQLRQPAEARYNGIAFSPDSSYVFFSIRDDANPNSALFKIPVFGGVQEKVLDKIGVFSLSPDGRQIAFARHKDDEKKDFLIVTGLDKSGEREIASFSATNSIFIGSISWSPDNQMLAFSAGNDEFGNKQDIYTAQVETGEVKRISNQNFGEIALTVWLDDASGLMLAALDKAPWSSVPQYQIWHVAYPSGTAHKVTTDLSSYSTALNVSKDARLLLTIEHRQLNNVWVAPSEDLSRAKQITFSSFGKYDGLWGMDWTPEGKIVYTNADSQSQVISIMNHDGSDSRQLTPQGFIDSQLTVSNDGRYIVFHSSRAGGFDIWRMDVDGGNPKQLTFGKKNYQPFISPDSRFVYYKCWENDVGELRRVSIDGGEPEILNDKETSWGSFSPDGKYFAASYKTDKYRLAVFSAETNKVIKQFDFPKNGSTYMGSGWTPDGKAVAYRDYNYGYWLQPTGGDEPHRMEGLPKEKFYNFVWSKDGKQFAFVRGQEIRDVRKK